MHILKILTKCYFPHCKWLHRGEGALKTAWAVLIVSAFDFFSGYETNVGTATTNI